MPKEKVSQEQAKAFAGQVFTQGKGVRAIKTILESFSGVGIDKNTRYIEKEVYFNLDTSVHPFPLGFMLEHYMHSDMWEEYGKFNLQLGDFPYADFSNWNNRCKSYYFKTETDVVNCLKAINQAQYSTNIEKTYKTVQAIICRYAFAFCNSDGYSQRI